MGLGPGERARQSIGPSLSRNACAIDAPCWPVSEHCPSPRSTDASDLFLSDGFEAHFRLTPYQVTHSHPQAQVARYRWARPPPGSVFGLFLISFAFNPFVKLVSKFLF